MAMAMNHAEVARTRKSHQAVLLPAEPRRSIQASGSPPVLSQTASSG